ncbi:MAG TPA: hypothetical protein VGO58_15840 [Chitinophagaceae bacterium]|jgi:hypothetical protein|nr:hypothetical protein [Chitinophagaceae bacterium]
MSHFLILVKGGQGISLEDINVIDRKIFLTRWKEWLRGLRRRKTLISGSPLATEGMAVYHNGNIETVPDNYDMVTEMITGFCLVEAKDETEALQILQTCPFLDDEFTSCELRKCRNFV